MFMILFLYKNKDLKVLMNFTINKIEEIYQQFNGEKVISGIKDNSLEIKFIKLYRWIIPLLILFAIIVSINIIPDTIKIIAYIIAFVCPILSILDFLNQSYKLYFYDNNIILENKLNKQTIIDVNRYPRIYIKKQEHLRVTEYSDWIEYTYFLHIEQDDNDIVFNMHGTKSTVIEFILNNIETKEKQDITESQWEESSSKKEATLFKYIKFLDKQEKIIGVKDSSKKMEIIRDSKWKKKIKICTILLFMTFVIESLITTMFPTMKQIDRYTLQNLLAGAIAFMFFADFLFLFQLVENRPNDPIKISYPSNESIKINRYLLNYKENNIMINIEAAKTVKVSEKYEYTLIINGEQNSYKIKLNMINEEQLKEFIDNLIFQEKKM